MMRRSAVSRAVRLTGLVVSAAALTLTLLGCGEDTPPPVGPETKAREQASTKNMENFMKSKPAPIGPDAGAKKSGGPQTK
jgi:hypothetical protein